jgi:hypothetical protein
VKQFSTQVLAAMFASVNEPPLKVPEAISAFVFPFAVLVQLIVENGITSPDPFTKFAGVETLITAFPVEPGNFAQPPIYT